MKVKLAMPVLQQMARLQGSTVRNETCQAVASDPTLISFKTRNEADFRVVLD